LVSVLCISAALREPFFPVAEEEAQSFLTFGAFLPSKALAAEVAKKVGLGWAWRLESAATARKGRECWTPGLAVW
jgi:hypothetical protein